MNSVLLERQDSFANIILHTDHLLDVNGNGTTSASVTELFPLSRSIDRAGKEVLSKMLLPQNIFYDVKDGFDNKEHFKISYDTDSEYLEVHNQQTKSTIRITIL